MVPRPLPEVPTDRFGPALVDQPGPATPLHRGSMSNVARKPLGDVERVLEVIRTVLAPILRDHTIRDLDGRDVTAEVIDERARNAAQAIVCLLLNFPRRPLSMP